MSKDILRWEDEGGYSEEEDDESFSGDREPRRPKYPPSSSSAELEMEESEEKFELVEVFE